MQKTYFVIPVNPFWNNDAIVNKLYYHYTSKDLAIKDAETLSRKYNEDFVVCSHEVKVSTPRVLVDYKEVD